MPDIKIRGWSGNEFAYQDVPKIWLDAAESTEESPVLVPYTYGEAVSKTVEPDFSGGDMEVPIAEGELVTDLTIIKPDELVPENIPEGMIIAGVGPGTFKGTGEVEERIVDLDMAAGDQVVLPTTEDINMSKVTIKKPDTLIPENIAEGVDIAGIIGTLAASSSNVKIATGTFTTQSYWNPVTVTHGMGVIPDVIIVMRKLGTTMRTTIMSEIGISSAFKKTMGFNHGGTLSSGSTAFYNNQGTIEYSMKNSFIFGATSTIFKIGNYTVQEATGAYFWIAIAGLT